MEAAQAKLRALPTIGQAGCRGAAIEALPQRDQWEYYTYASFLLGVENPDDDGPHLGLAGYYLEGVDPESGQATVRHAKIHPRFYYPIGRPTKTEKCASLNPSGGVWNPVWACNVSKYRVEGHQSYLRPFSGGVVLVNPSNHSDHGVPLGGKFFDPDKSEPQVKEVSTITMPPHTGKMMLRLESGHQ
eukprot:SAG25_NODE_87_length_16363_cov_40.489179_10_plen_187_part_00